MRTAAQQVCLQTGAKALARMACPARQWPERFGSRVGLGADDFDDGACAVGGAAELASEAVAGDGAASVRLAVLGVEGPGFGDLAGRDEWWGGRDRLQVDLLIFRSVGCLPSIWCSLGG
jgi:hypothetical protein